MDSEACGLAARRPVAGRTKRLEVGSRRPLYEFFRVGIWLRERNVQSREEILVLFVPVSAKTALTQLCSALKGSHPWRPKARDRSEQCAEFGRPFTTYVRFLISCLSDMKGQIG